MKGLEDTVGQLNRRSVLATGGAFLIAASAANAGEAPAQGGAKGGEHTIQVTIEDNARGYGALKVGNTKVPKGTKKVIFVLKGATAHDNYGFDPILTWTQRKNDGGALRNLSNDPKQFSVDIDTEKDLPMTFGLTVTLMQPGKPGASIGAGGVVDV
jgi:hypothetical protein